LRGGFEVAVKASETDNDEYRDPNPFDYAQGQDDDFKGK
jgi:hypothetical protein